MYPADETLLHQVGAGIPRQGLRRRVHEGQPPVHVIGQHHVRQALRHEVETSVALTQRFFRTLPRGAFTRQQLFQFPDAGRFEFVA